MVKEKQRTKNTKQMLCNKTPVRPEESVIMRWRYISFVLGYGMVGIGLMDISGVRLLKLKKS